MVENIEYKGDKYPSFQTIGNASQFAIPFAKHVCKGFGYDIGCMKKEWSFPGSYPIDLSFYDEWHSNKLPSTPPEYIFSSHCLEHVDDWVHTMNYWYHRLVEDYMTDKGYKNIFESGIDLNNAFMITGEK